MRVVGLVQLQSCLAPQSPRTLTDSPPSDAFVTLFEDQLRGVWSVLTLPSRGLRHTWWIPSEQRLLHVFAPKDVDFRDCYAPPPYICCVFANHEQPSSGLFGTEVVVAGLSTLAHMHFERFCRDETASTSKIASRAMAHSSPADDLEFGIDDMEVYTPPTSLESLLDVKFRFMLPRLDQVHAESWAGVNHLRSLDWQRARLTCEVRRQPQVCVLALPLIVGREVITGSDEADEERDARPEDVLMFAWVSSPGQVPSCFAGGHTLPSQLQALARISEPGAETSPNLDMTCVLSRNGLASITLQLLPRHSSGLSMMAQSFDSFMYAGPTLQIFGPLKSLLSENAKLLGACEINHTKATDWKGSQESLQGSPSQSETTLNEERHWVVLYACENDFTHDVKAAVVTLRSNECSEHKVSDITPQLLSSLQRHIAHEAKETKADSADGASGLSRYPELVPKRAQMQLIQDSGDWSDITFTITLVYASQWTHSMLGLPPTVLLHRALFTVKMSDCQVSSPAAGWMMLTPGCDALPIKECYYQGAASHSEVILSSGNPQEPSALLVAAVVPQYDVSPSFPTDSVIPYVEVIRPQVYDHSSRLQHEKRPDVAHDVETDAREELTLIEQSEKRVEALMRLLEQENWIFPTTTPTSGHPGLTLSALSLLTRLFPVHEPKPGVVLRVRVGTGSDGDLLLQVSLPDLQKTIRSEETFPWSELADKCRVHCDARFVMSDDNLSWIGVSTSLRQSTEGALEVTVPNQFTCAVAECIFTPREESDERIYIDYIISLVFPSHASRHANIPLKLASGRISVVDMICSGARKPPTEIDAVVHPRETLELDPFQLSIPLISQFTNHQHVILRELLSTVCLDECHQSSGSESRDSAVSACIELSVLGHLIKKRGYTIACQPELIVAVAHSSALGEGASSVHDERSLGEKSRLSEHATTTYRVTVSLALPALNVSPDVAVALRLYIRSVLCRKCSGLFTALDEQHSTQRALKREAIGPAIAALQSLSNTISNRKHEDGDSAMVSSTSTTTPGEVDQLDSTTLAEITRTVLAASRMIWREP